MTDTQNLPSITSNVNLLPNLQEFQMFQTIAKNAQESGLYAGVGGQSKIFMVLLAARELGISPMLALNGGIWNIQGKIEISARLMSNMIWKSGHSIKVLVKSNDVCRLVGKRKNGETCEMTYTIEDAKQAGLASRDVWKKYTSDMLYNRCLSRLARILFPDVIGSAYVEGEIRESINNEALTSTEYEEIVQDKVESICDKITQNILKEDENKEEKCDKITQEQLDTLLKTITLVDDTCLNNMCNYMQQEWGIEEYKDLPINAFDICMKALNNNIKMNSTKEKQA